MNLHPHASSIRSGRALRRTLASAATVATLVLAPAAAGAQTYGTTPPPTGPEVLPTTIVSPSGPVVQPVAVRSAPAASVATTRGSLAVTGGDVAGLAALGGAAVVAGAGLVLASRRRRATV